MAALTTDGTGDACDPSPDFVYAVSLLAALENATEQDGHAMVLPFLGMARAELTDFGQPCPARYIPIQIGDLQSGLADLERCLTALLAGSMELQHSLRINAALLTLRRGVIDAHPSSVGPYTLDNGCRFCVVDVAAPGMESEVPACALRLSTGLVGADRRPRTHRLRVVFDRDR